LLQVTGKHLFKGVSINFRTRVVGIFEIVEPVLEGDEVFDSNLLKQTMESMIAAGRRNISVDLSQLDYLYSDAINALVVMNKRMLDVFGRLSLLAPQPPVMEILKKGGIQNILKIFTDEAEIVQLSQQMTGQPMAAPTPSAKIPPQQPQSEFDDLRSEIGSAFEQGPGATPQQYAPQPYANTGAGGFQSAPQPQQHPQFAPPARPSFAPPPPTAGGPPRYAPPPRGFEPQKPMARAFTPPPQKPAPAPLAYRGEPPRRMPPVSEAPVALRPPMPPLVEPQPEEDLEKIEASLEKKTLTPGKHKPVIEDADASPRKRSLVPMLVALVVLIVAGAGGYYAYITYFQKTTVTPTPSLAPSETQAPTIPQLPVEATKETPAQTVPAVAPVVETPVPKPAVKTPEPVQVKKQPVFIAPKRPATPVAPPKPVVREPPPAPAPVKPVVVERPRVEEPPEPVEIPKPAPVVAAPAPTPVPVPTPAPAPAAEPAAAGGGEATIFIGTLPPLADVYMDGKYIGKSSTELKVTPGTHTLRFVKADKEFSKQFTFQPGKNPGTFVKLP
jgi:anti-anti-sigma factor